MRLTELTEQRIDGKDPEITGITADSRQVKKGFLFAAMPGNKADGRAYIADAIRHGAAAILAPEGTHLPEEEGAANVVLIETGSPRRTFAHIAAKFYRLQPETIATVTGTSGKTSTVSFVQQLWQLAGIKRAACLGTLGVRGPGLNRYGSLTTPDPATLHAQLADLAGAGVTHLAMEASSHGLDQRRLDGVRTHIAAFTNLSRDHLDYHPDMESYFTAKTRLFSDILKSPGTAILNADDPYFERLEAICKDKGHAVLSYGRKGKDIALHAREARPDGQEITISVDGKDYTLHLKLAGEFQAENALCALGILLASGAIETEKAPHFLEGLQGVPGRLQLISGHPQGAAVYVDYAHKPGALEAVLKTLRPHTSGKLVCLFGCGGDRDPGKRRIMGKIAQELADSVIVTDDNPRNEDPAVIRKQILEGATEAQEIADRRQAVIQAVESLERGDVLVVAGKGHEQGQIVGDTVYPFDDAEEIIKAIQNMKGVKG